SYTDEYFTSADNLETFGDYVLFNARIGYEQDRWSIFAYGRNVADKLYQTSGGNLTAQTAIVGEGSVFGVVGQYNF
ncbi:MAG: hypothetical protein AAGL09_13840, partial [Pseudomonadota bacterium]